MPDQDFSDHQEVQVGNLDAGAVEDPKHVEAMMKKAEEGTDTTGEGKRKYAGKYADEAALKSGAENLVKMKLAKMTPEEAEAFYNQLQGKKEAAAETEETKPAEETKTEETEETETKPEATEAEAEGLDITSMQNEWIANGKLSDESMAALKEAGFDKAMVDTYMAGMEVQLNSIFSKAGGKESYFQMLDWAGKNLSDTEINAFNETMKSQNIDSITLAVEGLTAKYTRVNGKGPARKIEPTTPDTTATTGFGSKAEMVEAMKDPRYGKDRAYTQRIEQRVFKSKF